MADQSPLKMLFLLFGQPNLMQPSRKMRERELRSEKVRLIAKQSSTCLAYLPFYQAYHKQRHWRAWGKIFQVGEKRVFERTKSPLGQPSKVFTLNILRECANGRKEQAKLLGKQVVMEVKCTAARAPYLVANRFGSRNKNKTPARTWSFRVGFIRVCL